MMAASDLPTVKVEGSLLPPDLLGRLRSGDEALGGLDPESFHLSGERIREATARSWNRLTGAWAAFSDARRELPDGAPTTALTRSRWLNVLFQELGFGQLEVNRSALEVGGREFAISHVWRHVPIHLVGCGFELERRYAGEVGVARLSAFGTLQQFLNRSNEHLWGIVSNGLRLRLLRDTVSLSRHAYIEFDLEAMMEGDIYSDFVLLWVLLHESRFEANEPSGTILEQWFARAAEEGTRALDRLRDGVEQALRALGRGFLRHPANDELLSALRSDQLDAAGYYRELLRLVYRMIFLFVAEDRDVLLDPEAPEEARQRYRDLYANARIRRMAGHLRGGRHDDLYRVLRLVMDWVSRDEGQPALGLYPLNSFLFSPDAIPHLIGANLRNRDLLAAVRHLAYVRDGHARRAVNFRLLGSREFGSVYESLLELHPSLDLTVPDFTLEVRPGHERKSTGSYYTPEPLIQSLLDSALDPVIERALASDKPAEALLDLKIVDPAAGGGHFLVSAAHRIADALARVRSATEEPPTEERRRALRDVVGHCLYGVDLNPMAAELCKVGLWLEGVEPGRPLSFLEHRIVCGNSLLGATPDLLAAGLPAGALKPIEGDEPDFARKLQRRSAKESKSQQMDAFAGDVAWVSSTGHVRSGLERVNAIDDSTVAGIHERQKVWEKIRSSDDFAAARVAADAWTAAFALPKTHNAPVHITHATVAQVGQDPLQSPAPLRREVRRIANELQFHHWHVAFPDVVAPSPEEGRAASGFDVVLGNPPWDQLEVDEDAMTADEQRRIRVLQHFVSESGGFPHTTGRKNLYALFVELALRIVGHRGQIGLVVPTGIVTDKPYAGLAEYIIRTDKLVSLIDFENQGTFPDVHRQQRVCLLTLTGDGTKDANPAFACLVDQLDEIRDPEKAWTSSYDELRAFSPGRFAVPMFASKMAKEIIMRAYGHGISLAEVRKTEDAVPSTLLYNGDQSLRVQIDEEPPADGDWTRVYEISYFSSYDHRYATTKKGKAVHSTIEQKRNPDWWPWTRYVMPPDGLERWVELRGSVPAWYLVLRRTARATDAITATAAIVPKSVAEGDVWAFWFDSNEAAKAALLCGVLNSFAFNYLLRNRQSGMHLSKSIWSQLPIPALAFGDESDAGGKRGYITNRVLGLTYTERSLAPFAKKLGFEGEPFGWDPPRRFRLRVEVEAAVFRAYGLGVDHAKHILSTFPILERQDIDEFGTYRTRDAIVRLLERHEAQPALA